MVSLQDFVTEIAERSYAVTLGPGETIYSVSLIRGQTTIPLTRNTDYFVSGSTIDLRPNLLQPGDRLSIVIRSG